MSSKASKQIVEAKRELDAVSAKIKSKSYRSSAELATLEIEQRQLEAWIDDLENEPGDDQ